MKRLKIEENKRKRKNKQLATSPYTPSPYSMDNSTASTFVNNNTQSNASPTNSYTPPSLQANGNSTMMSNGYNSNGLNPILYSQIDDSNMTNSLIMESSPPFNNLDKNYQSNNYFNNYNYPGVTDENFQQPEIVSQLVYSHYEQYKSSPEFGNMPTFSYNDSTSPIQYSSSFNSNSLGTNTDQFFSDSPSTFNSSTPISSISSPLNTLSISNNQQQQETLINTLSNDHKETEQQRIYSSEANQLNNQQITQSNNQPIIQSNNNQQIIESNKSSKPNLTILNNLSIKCLPDNLMIDEIFEQAIASKLRPSCDCKS